MVQTPVETEKVDSVCPLTGRTWKPMFLDQSEGLKWRGCGRRGRDTDAGSGRRREGHDCCDAMGLLECWLMLVMVILLDGGLRSEMDRGGGAEVTSEFMLCLCAEFLAFGTRGVWL